MSKFTPGPWEYCGCGKCALVWAKSGDGLLIHDSPDSKECAVALGDESIANALLIASAPDMYEGLRAIEALLSDPRAGEAGIQGAINTCKALLLQAEGKDAGII